MKNNLPSVTPTFTNSKHLKLLDSAYLEKSNPCSPNAPPSCQTTYPLKDDIIMYIDKDMLHASLTGLAKLYSYSPQHLSLLIRKLTNSSFREIYLERQLQRSIYLLENSNLSIELITDAIGYYNASTFCQTFKKAFGITPKAYRRAYVTKKITK